MIGHVTGDNYLFNKKAVFLMRIHNLSSHVTAKKKRSKKSTEIIVFFISKKEIFFVRKEYYKRLIKRLK